jgi:hypothetical protein
VSYAKHEKGDSCQGCLDRLLEGHNEIVEAFHFAKARHPDLHTSWVYRGPEDQEKARSEGASRARFGESPHNKKPSEAMDLFQIDENGHAIFDGIFCAKLNREFIEAGFKLKWGGEFKSLGDYGHWELIGNKGA